MNRALSLSLITLAALLFFAVASTGNAAAVEARRRVGRPESAGFPAYNNKPRVGASASRPAGVKDSLGNRVTEDHMNRVDFAKGREDKVMRRDPRTTEAVSLGRAHFATVYRHEFDHKGVFIDTALHHYNTVILARPQVLGLWRTHGFYGGFYWGFHPIVAIDAYFYNPLVYWFYVGAMNEYYYRNWYKAEYDAYPELHQAFSYPGLYYPTENLRQLLFGVSAMPVENQVHFRQAIATFTAKVAQGLANHVGTRVTLSKGDIIVTHYEILSMDEGIELEGLVTHSGASYDFKGLLDMHTPLNTSVVAPISMDAAPSEAQIQSLDQLNGQIAVLKGESVSATPEAPTAAPEPAAGEISAEPQAQPAK